MNEEEKEEEEKKQQQQLQEVVQPPQEQVREVEQPQEQQQQKEKIIENTNETDVTKKPKLFFSARLLLSIVCSIAIFNVSYVRIGISIVIVCMTLPRNNENINSGEFDWSSSTKGFLTSASFYGFIIGPSIAGFLSFKYGGKIIIIAGTFLTGSVNVFLPEGTRLTPVLFFIIRLVSGIFGSFIFPAFYDLMANWVVPEERQLLVGGSLIGIQLSSILNFPINTLTCNYMGWVWIFYLLSIWLIACGFLFVFTIYNVPEKCPFIKEKELEFLKDKIQKPVKTDIPWKEIIMSLPIYAYILMHFCINYVFLSIILSLPMVMEEVYHLPLQENGIISAMPFLGSLVVRVLLCFFFENLRNKLKLSKNKMRKIFISIGAVFISVFFLIITLLPYQYWYWVLGCFIIVSCSLELCVTGGYLLSLLDLCPSYVNIVSGVANSIGNTAGLICPVLNGLITINGTKEEWNVVFYVNITILLVSVGFYLMFGQSRTQYWDLSSSHVPTGLPRSTMSI